MQQMTVKDLLDALTNPKWWPDGVVNVDVPVFIGTYPGDDQPATAVPVFFATVQPVNEKNKVQDEDMLDAGRLSVVISEGPLDHPDVKR